MKKKGLILCTCLFSLLSVANANENGFFVGVGLGASVRKDTDRNNFGGPVKFGYKKEYRGQPEAIGSILLGGQSSNARFYLQATTSFVDDKENTDSAGFTNYSLNADFLARLVGDNRNNFGGFFGGFVGTTRWNVSAKDIRLANNQERVILKKTPFNAGVNLGLRGFFGGHHGLELAFKIPIKRSKIEETGIYSNGDRRVQSYAEVFNTQLRYTFKF